MVQELYGWFTTEMAERYGGITCPAILQGDQRNKLKLCPVIVEETLNKALEILDEHELL
jgi:hypothetical protein